jgi:hypothetical protein
VAEVGGESFGQHRVFPLQVLTFPSFVLSGFPLLKMCVGVTLMMVWCVATGCSLSSTYYRGLDASIGAGKFENADNLVAQAESDYGNKSRLLYLMDRGMTLHLAGRYQESNALLEEADQLVDDLFTRRVRNEVAALLVNDTQRPFEGAYYEQVMIPVIKGMNYATLGDWEGAAVEGRKIDHRLNVLADTVDPDDYHDDPFARYISGIFFEANGDFNNALVAYKNAYQGYKTFRPWLKVGVPYSLKLDLLRMTQALQVEEDHQYYQEEFSNFRMPHDEGRQNVSQIVIVGLTGRAPRIEDQFLDLPISLQALNVVLQTKAVTRRNARGARPLQSAVYGLNGHVVRVALPKFIPQPSQLDLMSVTLKGEGGSYSEKSHLVHSITTTAKKNLSDRMASTTVRAVARAALKLSIAEGIGKGAGSTAKKNSTQQVVQQSVSALARIFAIATEEADKRSWRTLPGAIHLMRLWVRPGTYEVSVKPFNRQGQAISSPTRSVMTLPPGSIRFLTIRFAN